MTDIKVKVLRTVRVAHPGTVYGREIVKDTIDMVPADLIEDLYKAGYIDEPDAQSGGDSLRGDDTTIAEYDPDLDKMTKAELEAFAVEKGIDISAAKNKAEAVDLIKAAVAASI